jgi:hypothetical protein
MLFVLSQINWLKGDLQHLRIFCLPFFILKISFLKKEILFYRIERWYFTILPLFSTRLTLLVSIRKLKFSHWIKNISEKPDLSANEEDISPSLCAKFNLQANRKWHTWVGIKKGTIRVGRKEFLNTNKRSPV